jgi:hypothetical protein
VGNPVAPGSTTASAPATTAASAPVSGAATSASQTIASFTKDVLARLSTAGENGTAKYSLSWKVGFLVSALSSVASPKDAEAQPAVKALADSLSVA